MPFVSTHEGDQPLADFALDNSVDAVTRNSYAKVQTGMDILLRSVGGYILPWLRTAEVVNKDTAKKTGARQQLGSIWRFLVGSFSLTIS